MSDDFGYSAYYVDGQWKQTGQAAPYVLRSEGYLKVLYAWLEENVSPHGYGWYINKDRYIVIADEQVATLLKLAFPDAHVVNSFKWQK